MNQAEALRIEKEKRKAVAKKRICWLLAILNIALAIYIVIQFIIIFQS
jgi:hypothetical protein